MESKRVKLTEIEQRGGYQELVSERHGKTLVNGYKLPVIKVSLSYFTNVYHSVKSYSYCIIHLKIPMRVNRK